MKILSSLQLFLAIWPPLQGSLTGQHLRVAVYHNPPHTFVMHNNTINGPAIELLKWLSRSLNFTFDLVPFNLDNVPEVLAEFLRRPDLDMLAPHAVISQKRIGLVDFTVCTDQSPSGLLLPAVKVRNFLWGPVEPFTPTVWTLILVCGVSAAVAMALARYKNIPRSSFSIQSECLHVLSVVTGQGEYRLPSSARWNWGFRLSAGVWCLGAVIFFNVYNSTLVSYLTKPKLAEYPQTSKAVVDEGSLIYLMIKNGVGQEIIMSATSGPQKKMADIFRKHPEYLVRNREEAFNYVASGCCAYTDLLSHIRNEAYRDYKETGQCRYSLGEVYGGYGLTALVLKKNSPYTNPLNVGILRFQELGLGSYWSKSYSNDMPCLKKQRLAPQKRVLNTRDVRFPFILLAIGYLLALVAFLFENFIQKP